MSANDSQVISSSSTTSETILQHIFSLIRPKAQVDWGICKVLDRPDAPTVGWTPGPSESIRVSPLLVPLQGTGQSTLTLVFGALLGGTTSKPTSLRDNPYGWHSCRTIVFV